MVPIKFYARENVECTLEKNFDQITFAFIPIRLIMLLLYNKEHDKGFVVDVVYLYICLFDIFVRNYRDPLDLIN